MNQHRKDFKTARDKEQIFLTSDKAMEILQFIDESLYTICTDVQEPVILTSNDIKNKVAKYKDTLEHLKKKSKKSPRLNYAVLAELGIEIEE
jgi:hypothetical protein